MMFKKAAIATLLLHRRRAWESSMACLPAMAQEQGAVLRPAGVIGTG